MDRLHPFEALFRLVTAALGHKDAVSLQITASDTAAKLMELGQAEALSAVDEHDGRIGNIDADFNDARRYQEVDISLLESLHDGLLFFSGHAAMNEAARAVLKEFMTQLFVKVGRGLKVDGLRGLYQGQTT